MLDLTLKNVSDKVGIKPDPTPTVTPSPSNPTSLQDTMVSDPLKQMSIDLSKTNTPASTTPTPTPTQPNTGDTPKTVDRPATSTPAPGASQSPAPTTPQFSDYVSTLQNKLKDQNVLADARAKLITSLYDRPLTADEVASLPPNIKAAVEKAQQTGDKQGIELQIRLLNDQIKGRNNTLDQGVNFLVNEHKAEQDRIDKQRQDAISNVLSFVDKYGSNAATALKSLYGADYVAKLKDYGIDINNLSSVKTLDEQKQDSINGVNTSGGIVTIPNNTLASRNNNPGNLRYVGQDGATLGANGFAKFSSPEAGYQALKDQIALDKSRNLTVAQFVNKYAPPSENDTNTYIKQFTDALGVPSSTKISDLSTDDIAQFMAKKESGTTLTPVTSDAQAIAEGIMNGTQPPVTTGLYKNSAPVKAALSRAGFDLTKALTQWNAAQALTKNLNSTQMIKLQGLAGSVVNTIDEVKTLSDQMKQGGLTGYNAAKLQVLINTRGNSPEGQLASKYVAAVNTLKEEFANLANGGYAPTDAAWSLANNQINGNYGVDQLSSTLDEVQRLVNYRLTAITGVQPLTPGGSTDYTAQLDAILNGGK